MKYGVTGTRAGMTKAQEITFLQLLLNTENIEEFHHGDCVGVDAAAAFFIQQHKPTCKIVCHPPKDPKLRAYFPSHELRPEKDYKIRNQAIVDEVNYLIVIPKEMTEQAIGGTWDTYKRGMIKKISMVLITPDGKISFPKKNITQVNNNANYKYWLQEIDELIDLCDWAYDTLSGIKDWVEANQIITERQIEAVENIKAAYERNNSY